MFQGRGYIIYLRIDAWLTAQSGLQCKLLRIFSVNTTPLCVSLCELLKDDSLCMCSHIFCRCSSHGENRHRLIFKQYCQNPNHNTTLTQPQLNSTKVGIAMINALHHHLQPTIGTLLSAWEHKAILEPMQDNPTNIRVKPNFRWIVLGCLGIVFGLCCVVVELWFWQFAYL